MNRIAVKIKEARLKAKMTEKQLAKKCGLAESYIIQVESGKKVINESAAERILSILGEKIEFVPQQELQGEKKPEGKSSSKGRKESIFYDVKPTDQWADALASIIKTIPIYDLGNDKIVGEKNLPIINKKIEGYYWDKITFVKVNTDDLEGLRIKKEDLAMICLGHEIENNRVYLVEHNGRKILRKVKRESGNQLVLLKGKKGEEGERIEENKIKILGKCVKIEFQL